MAPTSLYLAEEALSLPAEQRRDLARLLLESLTEDNQSDDAVRQMLQGRLADLTSGRDQGMTFEQVFAPKA